MFPLHPFSISILLSVKPLHPCKLNGSESKSLPAPSQAVQCSLEMASIQYAGNSFSPYCLPYAK